MVQVMEGVDNEVILTFVILLGCCFIVVAVYFKSRTARSFRQSSQQAQPNNSLDSETERNSNTIGEQGNNDDATACDRITQSGNNSDQNFSNKTKGVRRCREQSNCENKYINSKTNKTTDYTNENNEESPAPIGTIIPCQHNTSVGPGISGSDDGINSDFNTNSLHGNIAGSSNTINSCATIMEPSTSASSSYENDLQQTASDCVPSNSGSVEPGRRVTIRVKYQETERSLTVDISLKVGDLKRHCFPTEMRQGQTVHLVYSGRLLSNDNVPISYYGVGNHSVIHAQISAAPPSNQSQRRDQLVDESDIDMGQIFLPLLMLILCICWYGLITYRNIFSTMSTAILIVLTAAYALVVYSIMG